MIASLPLAVVVSYDGGRFHGWQAQPDQRTVQGVLEQVLARLHGVPRLTLAAAGRTDAGVHALAQVASYRPPTAREPEALHYALMRLLPTEVRPLVVAEMPADFHACRSAIGKLYRYRIINRPLLLPFEAPLAWHLPQPLDLAAMRAAATRLLGTHDVASLTTVGGQSRTSVRTIRAVRLREHDDGQLLIDAEADGFLYRMVRVIVALLVDVGRGRRRADDIARLLAEPRVGSASAMAPAQGLCLVRVRYPAGYDPLERGGGE